MIGNKPYKIYELVDDDSPDVYRTPININFRTGLTSRLQPKRVMNQGDVVECIHYVNFDGATYSDPVVKETWTYTNDPTGYPQYRVHEVMWYDEDGDLDESNKKSEVKYYVSLQDKRHVAHQRRVNRTTKASETVIGFLMQGVGMSYTDAVSNGFTYWSSLVAEVNLYESGDTQPLIDRISNDTAPAWLDAARPLILAEL